ncbi:MAG: 30S ribosomal protein S2 [Patescibacteria group bacterium]|nr:30S ribosomal protein S2 [Patescibacteria group bacterium]
MLKEKEQKTEDKSKKSDFGISVREMAEAGLHFGHKVSCVHPKMYPYIYGVRNTIHIIETEKTKENLIEALKFIQKLIAEKKVLLLVGTKEQIKDLIKDTAESCGFPYVNERWLGGLFTNFAVIKKRIEYFKDLENKEKQGELKKYTKKERAKFSREIKNLRVRFGGLRNLEKTPDAIFICDMKKDAIAVNEAKAKGVKVIGIADTNVDPRLADYPIPANDDAILSVKYILEKVKEAIKK